MTQVNTCKEAIGPQAGTVRWDSSDIYSYAVINDYVSSSQVASSLLGSKISPVGVFPCLPLINMCKGRVYDVIYCFILEKKMRSSVLI